MCVLVFIVTSLQAALKNYAHKSSMEEKQDQVERFKVRNKLLTIHRVHKHWIFMEF